MKKRGIASIAIFGLAGIAFVFWVAKENNYLKLPDHEPLKEDLFIKARSEIGTPENPQARKQYWFNLQKDPETGELPVDIRRKEIQYASKLPKKNDDPRLRNSKEDWSSAGPYNVGGRTRAAKVHIENENVILAGGVSGGMFRTTNGGEDWQEVTHPQSLHSVTTLAQDTRSGKTDTWYYGTGEIQGNSARAPFAPFRGNGIFKSSDNGLTWQQLVSTEKGDPTLFNSQFQYVWRVMTNPFNLSEDEVYAAIVGAVVKSVDGGQTWKYVLGENYETAPDLNGVNAANFTDVEITSEGILYATLSQEALVGSDPNSGIYRSVDGETWTEITPAGWPFRYARVVIGSAPSSPDVVYFLLDGGENNDQIWRYTYRSGNGAGSGGSWEDLSNALPDFGGEVGEYDDQNSYNMLIRVHPEDEEIVYLGGTNLYRSTNGFISDAETAWIGGYDTANNFEVYPNHYVDQHDLFFYPKNPDKMLSVNDGGVFVTENNTAPEVTWKSLNNGFLTAQAYTIGFDLHTPSGYLISGFQDNGTQIAKDPSENTAWHRFLGGDGAYCEITRGQDHIYASFQEGQIYRFTVNENLEKTTFARVDPVGGGEIEGQEYLFVNPFVLDPNNNNVMYLTGGDAVWRNRNLSQIPLFSREKTSVNWAQIPGTRLDFSTITSIAVSTQPANIVYYGTSHGELFRIDNALDIDPVVTDIRNDDFPAQGYTISIAVDRTNADHIMVAFSNYNIQSIFHSDDAGETFTHVSGNLEEFEDGSGAGPSVRWVDIYPRADGSFLYFAATSTGLYSTELLDGSNTVWVQEGASTIGNVVSVMVKHRPTDGAVLLATHGGGLYKSYFDNPAPVQQQTITENTAMAGAYPNPFTTSTTIPYYLPADGPARVKIIDVNGREVRTLMWSYNYAGENFVTWDGTNEAGVALAEGVYFCQLEFQNKKIATKLIYKKGQ